MSTLPLSEISNGLAEIIKLAIIKDSKLFEILENNQKKLLDFKFYKTKMAEK